MQVWRCSQILHHFEGGAHLAGNSIRVDRVHDYELPALPEFLDDRERVIEVAVDRDHFGAISKRLDQLTAGNLSRWQNNGAAKSGPRRVSSRRGRGVAGGRANQRGCSALDRL